MALSLLAGLVAACVAPFPPELKPENKARIAEVFEEAYEGAGEAYIEVVALSDMALAGLAHLAAIDPGLAVNVAGETVTLTHAAEPYYRFEMPASDEASDWADAVAKALIAAHGRSRQLQAADRRRLYENYMTGVAGTLGDDSQYSPSEEFYGYLSANFHGLIDLTYVQTADGLRVLALDHEGRLAAAGLKTEDVVMHIDGKATATRSHYEVYSLLSGPVDSRASLNVMRDGQPLPSVIVVQRWQVTPRSYELIRKGDIAVYSLPVLNEFGADSLADSLLHEITRGKYRNQPIAGLLLDLRGDPARLPSAVNSPSVTFGGSRTDWSGVVGYIDHGFMSGPGGSPDAARRLADAFMSSGVVFRQRGRHHVANREVTVTGSDPSDKLPLIIVVDSSTIGGAEMAVASLQDYGRALVIGGSTAGSGVIRRNATLYNLGAFNFRWAQAYAPSGYNIEGRGIMPNICTTKHDTTLGGLLAELRRGGGIIDEVTRQRKIDPDDKEAMEAYRSICPAKLAEGDLALELALAILADPGLYTRLLRTGAARRISRRHGARRAAPLSLDCRSGQPAASEVPPWPITSIPLPRSTDRHPSRSTTPSATP